MANKKYLTTVKDWRLYFDNSVLESAEKLVQGGYYTSFMYNSVSASAYIGKTQMYTVSIHKCPLSYTDSWNTGDFYCTCSAAAKRRKRKWWDTTDYGCCQHEAALLMLWEAEQGPWEFTETEEEWQERQEQERQEREQRRLKQLKEKESKIEKVAGDWGFSEAPGDKDIFFNIPRISKDIKTDLYSLHSGKEYVEHEYISFKENPGIKFGDKGNQVLTCSTTTKFNYEYENVSVTIDREEIVSHSCTCKGYYRYYNPEDRIKAAKLCGHELATLDLLWNYVLQENPGDMTDSKANAFFSFMDDEVTFEAEESIPEAEKIGNIVIKPRLQTDGNTLNLSFKVGKAGQRMMVLKGFRKFEEAYNAAERLELGKDVELDFSKETVEPGSEVWLDYIFSKVNEADRVNSKISSYRYGYYGRGVSVQNNESLRGAALDRFFTIANGTDVEWEDKRSKEKGNVRIGTADFKIEIRSRIITADKDILPGIKITGVMPRVIFGQNTCYVFNRKGLGKVDDMALAAINPFLRVANSDGVIDFTIGKNRLAEFYYRTVPAMSENPYIEFEDDTSGALDRYLPPEPIFTFFLDYEDASCILKAQVEYNGRIIDLASDDYDDSDQYRDLTQEERVVNSIREFFPISEPENGIWRSAKNEDSLFKIASECLNRLGRFGEVQATESFMGKSVRHSPDLSFNISVDSDLLDIEIISKDISPWELIQIYESYKLRKKYHRLTDGSFVDLSEMTPFQSIEQIADNMGMTVEDLINGKKNVPLYRALYLDYLLSEHEELTGNRNRTYRALVKSFRTVRDSEYDVPREMENVLRPYQTYGHKWMRTVLESGFGGILADEMGLGKTLETISVISAMKRDGETEPVLVVCPASLIYNWEEECIRFAPDLKVTVVAGTAANRKKMLKNNKIFSDTNVFVTSYDLLRQDISTYKDLQFGLMVIDEAQYIKNPKAALSKAVKIVHAKRRIALTGTPIENRLSELWSIFDYLMPGFLYDRKTFTDTFEIPITKRKDESATDRLKQMTGSFILRRKKEDVLKDLPPKLEEIRYVKFEDKQREVYDAQVVRMKNMLKDIPNAGAEDKIKILAELMHIRQICCDPSLMFEDYYGESAKRLACMELIRNAIEGGHKVLVFSQFTSMLEILQKDLEAEEIDYFKITGADPKEKRLKRVHEFNDGEVPVFLISLKAGGTGLNLTGADIVIHYDPWWNVAAMNQATDRAHRIGQTKTVTVYKIIAKDTIEEKIVDLQNAKKDLAETILSGEQQSIMNLSVEELMDIL